MRLFSFHMALVLTVFSRTAPALCQATNDAEFDNGKMLFRTNCGSCHNVHQEVVGPQLASITKKRTSDWLMRFIRNSQSVIEGGDAYANILFEKYRHQVMPSFRQLSTAEMTNILHYIEVESFYHANEIRSGIDVDQESDPSIFHGQLIFQLQCAACHFIDHEGSYGPALGSVPKRHPDRWLHEFIRKSQKVIASGDAYAVQLFNRYDHRVMVTMEFLKDDEIDDVLKYIEFRCSSDHRTAGVSGRRDAFGKKYSEIHSPTRDRVFEGATAVGGVVFIIIITGFGLYVFTVRRIFLYLQRDEVSNKTKQS